MQTISLEDALHQIAAANGLHVVSVGLNTNCTRACRFSASVHWEGFSRDNIPCSNGHGPSVRAALNAALASAKNDRTPHGDDDCLDGSSLVIAEAA